MLLDCRHLSKWFHTQHSAGVVSGLKKKKNKTKSEKKKVKKKKKEKDTYVFSKGFKAHGFTSSL